MQARVLRVLEYTGPLDEIVKHLERRFVKGISPAWNGITIREAIIGELPEILKEIVDGPQDNNGSNNAGEASGSGRG